MGSRFACGAQVTRSRLAAVATLAIASALTVPARAEDTAADHAKRAEVAYAIQDWKTAMTEYQAAYRLDQKPEYLWSLGQSQRQSGDCTSAIKSYKSFMRSATNKNQVEQASANIKLCDADLAREAEQKDEAARKAEEERRRQEEERRRAEAAQKDSAAIQPAASPPEAPPPPPPKRWYKDTFGHVLTISGVVAVGTGVVFLVKSSGEADSETYDATAFRVAGMGGLVVGGTLIANGILRYVLVDGTTPRVGAVLGPRTAGLGVSGQF